MTFPLAESSQGVQSPGLGNGAGHNCIPARVVEVTYLGEDLHVGLELADGHMLRAALKNTGTARAWTPMQSVEIVVDPGDLRLLWR